MTMITGAGRAAMMAEMQVVEGGVHVAEEPVITPESAANEREWQVDAAGAHDARSAMLSTALPAGASRPEMYAAISNQALAHAGFTTPLSGGDTGLQDAIAAVRANPLDGGARAALQVAVAKETERAALIGALDLPAGYKNAHGALAASPLTNDKHALAALQANADLGMETAREMIGHRMTKEQLFAQSPDLAKAYASDPAFHAGFDAYVYADKSSRGDLSAIHARLDQESIANQRALANMYFPA